MAVMEQGEWRGEREPTHREVWEEARHLAANYAKSKAYGSYWPTDEEVEQSGAYGELSEHSEIYIG